MRPWTRGAPQPKHPTRRPGQKFSGRQSVSHRMSSSVQWKLPVRFILLWPRNRTQTMTSVLSTARNVTANPLAQSSRRAGTGQGLGGMVKASTSCSEAGAGRAEVGSAEGSSERRSQRWRRRRTGLRIPKRSSRCRKEACGQGSTGRPARARSGGRVADSSQPELLRLPPPRASVSPTAVKAPLRRREEFLAAPRCYRCARRSSCPSAGPRAPQGRTDHWPTLTMTTPALRHTRRSRKAKPHTA